MVVIKRIVKKLLGIKEASVAIDPSAVYGTISYAQEGEDLVLKRFLGDKTQGFYVDIGAHHPFRFSNTYLFYKQGWRGINIDAMPGSMDTFIQHRSNDINIEIPVSGKKQLLTYYIFNEPALNTFSKEEAEKKDGLREYRIIKKVELETAPLSEILSNYLPQDTKIDFLSIDVEGLDFEVLQSNNWDKFRPSVILIESLRSSLDEMTNNEVYVYLNSLGYRLVAKTLNTLFFKSDF